MDRHRLNLESIARALHGPLAQSSDYDFDAAARPAAEVRLRPASVLVPLVERGAGLSVVLTRRAARLAHHPGQVAFPGGKQDPRDADALAAALREAEEEIGLPPALVQVLGAFDPHETVTQFLVTPFVGLVTGPFEPRPDRAEVDEVFEAPLAFVLDPANMQVHRRRWGGHWRQYYAIPYGPHYIWGATARILKTLADRLGER
ncbi:MAG: CoA pyrophosphatase [Rhodobacteraceae bacterium]|nr:CoA pyrophosphatase [Paracoccaceae bacterium]